MIDKTPGIQNIQWRFYIIFAVLNASFIPIIWLFYVETAGLSLDEIDRVFAIKHAPGRKITYKEATQLAKEEMEAERLQIREETAANGEKEGQAHFEKLV